MENKKTIRAFQVGLTGINQSVPALPSLLFAHTQQSLMAPWALVKLKIEDPVEDNSIGREDQEIEVFPLPVARRNLAALGVRA